MLKGCESVAKINTTIGNVSIKLDTKRLDRNMMEAQKELNLAVRKDTTPFVPKREGSGGGTLIRSANFPDGVYGGVLEYNTPYARYQYEGKVYGPNIPIRDEVTGEIIGWWSPKHKHPTGKSITYHPEGTARGDHWFEKSKEKNLQSWIETVRKEVGRN